MTFVNCKERILNSHILLCMKMSRSVTHKYSNLALLLLCKQYIDIKVTPLVYAIYFPTIDFFLFFLQHYYIN